MVVTADQKLANGMDEDSKKLKISQGKMLAACHVFCRDSASLVPAEAAIQNNDSGSGFGSYYLDPSQTIQGFRGLNYPFTSTQELNGGQYSGAEGSSVMGFTPTHPSM